MMRRLSAAVAGCYAAVQFHLFKPSDILGDFLKCVGGNPAYVDIDPEHGYDIVFLSQCFKPVHPCGGVMQMFERHKNDPTFPPNMGDTR